MKLARMLIVMCLMAGSAIAQEARVTELMSKDLTEFPGKEGLMILVEYPPGSSDPVHRHYAHAFVYVLEGSIVMQVRGGQETTLTAGHFLRRPERCSRRWEERQQNPASQICCLPGEREGRPDIGAR